MINKKILKKENQVVVLTVALLGLVIIIGTSFALWNLTFRQTSTNQINTSCFKIDFTEKDDINLSDAYPLTDEEASKLSPYTFTITNICDTSATYQVNLEELEVEEKKLSNQYINLSLNEKTGRLSTFGEVNKTLDNATTSHKLTTGVLKEKESKSFELRLWLRNDAPATEEIMNASFLSKITIITIYKKNVPEVNATAYENQDTIKVDVNTIKNLDNETLNYYYQLDNNEEIKSNIPNYTFSNLQDGTYKIKVRVEDTNGIVIFEKEENVTVSYVHVYISNTGNDTTGNGSPDSPYATLQRAYNKVKSGGEMILQSDITVTSTTNMNIANKVTTLKRRESNNYTVKRSNSFTSRVIYVANTNTVTMTNITLDGNRVNANGSLLHIENSTLNLNNGTVVQNNNNVGTLGGGISIINGTMTINNSMILNNTTAGNGGGIAMDNGTIIMNDGTIRGNSASQSGGGIFMTSDSGKSTLTIKRGAITNNVAQGLGGGIFVMTGTSNMESIAYIAGGIISNNTASTGSDFGTAASGQIIDQR